MVPPSGSSGSFGLVRVANPGSTSGDHNTNIGPAIWDGESTIASAGSGKEIKRLSSNFVPGTRERTSSHARSRSTSVRNNRKSETAHPSLKPLFHLFPPSRWLIDSNYRRIAAWSRKIVGRSMTGSNSALHSKHPVTLGLRRQPCPQPPGNSAPRHPLKKTSTAAFISIAVTHCSGATSEKDPNYSHPSSAERREDGQAAPRLDRLPPSSPTSTRT